MKVISRDEKDAFDRITHNLGYLEKERYNILANMLHYNSILETKIVSFPAARNYMISLSNFTKEQIETNHKECGLYKKMLRYLQLMITNGTYDYYTDSLNYDYINKIIEILEYNKTNRAVKREVFNYSINLGVSYRAPEVVITSLNDRDDVITDELFDELEKLIPKR